MVLTTTINLEQELESYYNKYGDSFELIVEDEFQGFIPETILNVWGDLDYERQADCIKRVKNWQSKIQSLFYLMDHG